MTFYKPSGSGPVLGVIALMVVGVIGTIFFFSFRECRASGIGRSGKTSDATELYQVFPASSGNKKYFLSLEGVFKTTIYNRQGGITTRSGSTDIRLSLHDLANGEKLARVVLGDYHDAYTKILGVNSTGIWLYNLKDGLHCRNMQDLEIITRAEDIIAKNSDLAEGLAQAKEHLGDLDELFAFNSAENSLMVTTVSGKRLMIDAGTFQTKGAAAVTGNNNEIDDIVEEMIREAENASNINMDDYYGRIMEAVSDMSSFSDLSHTNYRALGADSCEYKFEGSTIKTLVQGNCPQPRKISGSPASKKEFIEPVFITSYNAATQQYINLPFIDPDKCLLLHASKIGSKPDLQLSYVNIADQNTVWTIKTGITLDNYRSSFNINGTFGNRDTLFLVINDQLLCTDLNKGKILWKSTIAHSGYDSQLYYEGLAVQKNQRYFISASSFFTEISRQGFFIEGRTDHQLVVTDGKTGKQLNKITSGDDAEETMPYYLGMADGKCWFYSNKDLLHIRSLPDLKIIATPFSQALKDAGITTPLVKSDHYDGGIENKYIAMDIPGNAFYFTTENGLHYKYDLIKNTIAEMASPEDGMYEKWMQTNPFVEFYRVHQQNMYHYDLPLRDGSMLQLIVNNSVGSLHLKAAQNAVADNKSTAVNQFIEGAIITNGIAISGNSYNPKSFDAALTVDKNDRAFYIWHKDKIAQDAHQVISKYNYANNSIVWKYDVTAAMGAGAEIVRIFTDDQIMYCILKSHPELDDSFTCIAIDSKTGKEKWKIQF